MRTGRKSTIRLFHNWALIVVLAAGQMLACGIGEEEVAGVREAPVLNGAFDTTRTAVAQISLACSGTFIAPRLFLVAAHCLPPCPAGGPNVACREWTGSVFVGHEGPITSTISVVARFNGCTAQELLTDPNCQATLYQTNYVLFPKTTLMDVAILQVTQPFTGPVLPLMEPDKLPSPTTLNDYINDAITMVGYSNNNNGDDSRRRSGSATVVSAIGTTGFRANTNTIPGQVICAGDSGGPEIFTLNDGSGFTEQVGGVTSVGLCDPNSNYAVGSAYIPKEFAKRAVAVQHSAYLGCYNDATSRDLPVLIASQNHMTPTHCVGLCQAQNYAFAGVQYGRYCFCGSTYGKYGKVADGDCNTPCVGDANQTCGGSWKNAVYAVSLGCYKDAPDRDLPTVIAGELDMTVQRCIGLCAAQYYSFAGVQYRYWCTCGSSYGKHGASNKCVHSCGGDSSQSCGGAWANDVFWAITAQSP